MFFFIVFFYKFFFNGDKSDSSVELELLESDERTPSSCFTRPEAVFFGCPLGLVCPIGISMWTSKKAVFSGLLPIR